MARYINAERLKDSLFAYYDCLGESANGRPYKGDTLMDYEVVDMIEDCIDNAPTADVEEVKHGEWIRPTKLADMMHHDIPHCSLCGEVPCDEGKYCPNCGAKMDGGKAE